MGQREGLLAGAKQCLALRGYARTTARDIVAVTGANLASIGYHFGSKDALLNAAILETFDEWGEAIADAMDADLPGTAEARLELFLQRLLAEAPERRDVLVASVQAYAQAEFAPDLRDQLLHSYVGSRRDLAALILAVDPEQVSPDDARAIGSLALALINGVMLQWMVDPASTPSAKELARAIRAITS